MMGTLCQPNVSTFSIKRMRQPNRQPCGRSGDARRLRLDSVQGIRFADTMKSTFLKAILTICLTGNSTSANAETLTCKAKQFCWSHQHRTPAGCQPSSRVWEVKTKGWRADVSDGENNLRFKEERPYFVRGGWYHFGDVRNGTAVKLKLPFNEDETAFSLRKLAKNSVSHNLWKYTGDCLK